MEHNLLLNAMVYLGWVDAGKSIYAGNRLIWLSNLLGGALFGVGIAVICAVVL